MMTAVDFCSGYSPTGDIMVISTCFVLVLLLKVTYTNRTRSFLIFKTIIFLLFLSAVFRLGFYSLIGIAGFHENVPLVFVKLLYCLYHTTTYLILFLLMCYMVEPLHIDKRIAKGHIGFFGFILSLAMLHMYVNTFLTKTFDIIRRDQQIIVKNGINLFFLGYGISAFLIIFMIFYYRKRIYRQVIIGIVGSGVIAMFVNVIQYSYGQNALTLATFLFPIFAVLFMLHSNPYDMEVGTMNARAFQDMLKSTYGKKYLLVEYYMHNMEKNGKDYPQNMRSELRDIFNNYFSPALFFQVSSGRIIFAVNIEKNVFYEQHCKEFITEARKIFAKHKMDYKCIAVATRTELKTDSDYLGIMRYIGSQIKENDYKIATEEEVLEYLEQRKIIMEMEDISKTHNLDDERVLVYCQPVYNIRAGEYDTGEALMRLKMNDQILMPGQFIPLAEKNGTLHTLGLIILNKTCKEIRKMLDQGYRIERISVNFSIQDFRDEKFCDDVQLIVAKSGIPFHKIALEITETQNEYDFLLVKTKMEELKHSGIKFYLDDFGTGYSNYRRIMELPFDIIKFDSSLVSACSLNEKSSKMVENTAKMFADLHYSILYEGVETKEDIDHCLQMNGEYLQGFHYSQPIPIEEMTGYFRKDVDNG